MEDCMHNKKSMLSLSAIGLILVLGSALWLATAQPVSAACGSQTSSCKDCHEIQGQDPVNNDGTAWHTQHAFGDFCYLCHAGNNQAADIEAAHTGMVPPLSDINANCLGCHPNDAMQLAQVYATTLGVEVGTGGGGSAATRASNQPMETAAPAATEAAPAGMVVESPDVIDYVQQYNETVLNQKPINWGNVIAGVMIALMALGGGAFIFMNEKKRRPAMRPVVAGPEEATPIHLEDYPPEVVALLPQIAALNPRGRKALQILLKDPDAASEILFGLSRLDPDLIKRVKTLDREAQALLLALAGD
jgi:hypothetical protein